MKKLFLTGFPSGQIKVVETLGENPNIENGIYIIDENGGTDTTTDKFLFDVPASLTTLPAQEIIDE